MCETYNKRMRAFVIDLVQIWILASSGRKSGHFKETKLLLSFITFNTYNIKQNAHIKTLEQECIFPCLITFTASVQTQLLQLENSLSSTSMSLPMAMKKFLTWSPARSAFRASSFSQFSIWTSQSEQSIHKIDQSEASIHD